MPYSESEVDTVHQVFLNAQQPSNTLSSSDRNCEMTQEEENKLARLIAEQGDEKATVTLYRCFLTNAFNYFYQRTGSNHEAEDLTEETFLRAIKGLQRGTWSGHSFRAWFFTIAKNVFLEWLRARRSEFASRSQIHLVAEMDRIKQVDLLEEVLIRERKTLLWELVRELPEPDQHLLSLRYVDGLRYAEIATHLKCTEKACKTLALASLRETKGGPQSKAGRRVT